MESRPNASSNNCLKARRALTGARAAGYGSRVAGSPLRVGVLHDFPRADGGAAFEWALRLGLDAGARQGRLPQRIDFVHQPAHAGEQAVEHGFARLVDQGVLAIIGPALTDGALVATPLADAAAIPCLNYAGNDQARGAWMFHFQIGSLEDEPPLLIGEIARRELTRVALIQDPSAVGARMAAFLVAAAASAGREIVTHVVVANDGGGAGEAVAAARAAGAEAVVSLGFWRAAQATARAMRGQSWSVPAFANSALMYGHADPAFAADWDGWTYADTYDEANPRFAALAQRAAADGRSCGPGEAGACDMGQLLAEAIARAPEVSRAGLRAGFERVKALPTATGRAATLMGFGNWDRGALKGPYLVLRQWRNGCSQATEVA